MPDLPQVVVIAPYDAPTVEERAALEGIDCELISASVASSGEVFEARTDA